MISRKYTIEATTKTLALFLSRVAALTEISDTLIRRVSTNSTEEYHYVVLLAEPKVHDDLRTLHQYHSVGML